jgi:hypothetical protein
MRPAGAARRGSGIGLCKVIRPHSVVLRSKGEWRGFAVTYVKRVACLTGGQEVDWVNNGHRNDVILSAEIEIANAVDDLLQ